MPRPKKTVKIPDNYPDFDKEKFGDRFGKLLKENNYTVESFSATSGISDSMIKAIKNETRSPSLENYVKIIELLHVNEMELLRDSIQFSSDYEAKKIMLTNRLMPLIESLTLEQTETFIKGIAHLSTALCNNDTTEGKDECN